MWESKDESLSQRAKRVFMHVQLNERDRDWNCENKPSFTLQAFKMWVSSSILWSKVFLFPWKLFVFYRNPLEAIQTQIGYIYKSYQDAKQWYFAIYKETTFLSPHDMHFFNFSLVHLFFILIYLIAFILWSYKLKKG